MDFLFKYSDSIQSFPFLVGGRTCKYTGSKRKLRFIQYLCETSDPLVELHYKQLFDAINHENIHKTHYYIDKIFFDSFMFQNGWLDKLEIKFEHLPDLTSGSTKPENNKTIITINKPLFETAIKQMRVADGSSVGFNRCRSVVHCELYCIVHEFIHACIQICSGYITCEKQIIMFPSDKKLLQRLLDDGFYLTKKTFWTLSGSDRIAFGVPLNKSIGGGHCNVFQLILMRFGIKETNHNLLDIKF